MFRPLGLFLDARCPDPTCRRPNCLFLHGESSRQSRNPAAPATTAVKPALLSKNGVKAVALPTATSVPLRKREADIPSGIKETVKKPKVEEKGKGTPMAAVINSRSTKIKPLAPVSAAKSVKPPPAKVVPTGPLPKEPTISVTSKNSPQALGDRQKALRTLFQQYTTKYAAIMPLAPDLAHKHALAEESEISAAATSLRAYKTTIHHAAVSVSRRTPPTSLNHPSVGTNRESRLAHEKEEKEQTSRPTRSRIEQYCMTAQDFIDWNYPSPSDTTLTEDGGEEPDGEGSSQTCSRCKVPFVVDSKDLEARLGECKFHYGRLQPERIEGRRMWIYTCCKRERGEAGCEDGVHVFTEREDDLLLKRRHGFRTVKQINTDPKLRGWVDVVAMDCEMIYTTAGTSLARATIVDEDGKVLLDELVRQTVPILDVNTRFSGVNPGDLDTAAMTLDAVRAAACMFIGPDTIMVGHGLENDLRALRLVHAKVIDTAILFPHDKGKPFRRALRDIVKEKLGYFIQDRTSDLGHSSAEDARATLECLKWKVRTDG